MPVVNCGRCRNAVTLPDPWSYPVFTCPYCLRSTSLSASAAPPLIALHPVDYDAENEEQISNRPNGKGPQDDRRPSWLMLIAASFLGAFLAGLLLMLGVRIFAHASITDSY